MLGKTAGGLLWMARYLERSENIARLVEAGLRIALTRSVAGEDEWASIITTAAARDAFTARYSEFDAKNVINFLLRDQTHESSVRSVVEAARNNARMVRTALTREVWEAVNVCWMTLRDALARPVEEADLPSLLMLVRQQSALVRGATHGTMLRNDIYNFIRLGTFLERADNTARILDVKYYVLLPEVSFVGAPLDNAQWETILRSASAERAFGWLHGGEATPIAIAEFLILDRRMPRSLAFCYAKLVDNLAHLTACYGERRPSHARAEAVLRRFDAPDLQAVFDSGLHEFVTSFIRDNNNLGRQIEIDYRFYA
jgi:uncharacterized alpha-E superfamily protein